jgi:hypothetical protein
MSSEEIVQQLQEFVLETGRLPRPDEPGLRKLIEAATKVFGSLENALGVAGLLAESPPHRESTLEQKPRKRNTSVSYPEDYFLNLLNLKRKSIYGSPARDGTPTWWERRAKMRYNCSSCQKPIEKGERYIGCKRLHPGVRGVYGHRGTYSTNYYHLVCLLKEEKTRIENKINDSNSEINRIEGEIRKYQEAVSAKKDSIEICQEKILQVRRDYERTSGFWKKAGGWLKCGYTSWSRNREVSRLKDEIAQIERQEIPERQNKMSNLMATVRNLRRKADVIEARIRELVSSQNC